jgi:hypothetical protein
MPGGRMIFRERRDVMHAEKRDHVRERIDEKIAVLKEAQKSKIHHERGDEQYVRTRRLGLSAIPSAKV